MLLRVISPLTLILLFLVHSQTLSQSNSIPCLNSTPDCLTQLTNHAISNSREVINLEAKIELIEERISLMEQKIDHANSRTWTNYLTLDPLRLMQNIFGGGDVQADRINIANLELSVTELEAVKGELERQTEEKKVEIENEVLGQLLNYEASLRQLNLAQNQLTTFEHQQQIALISYRLGQGTTQDYLNSQLRQEQLNNNLLSIQNQIYETIRTIHQITGYEFNQQNYQWTNLNHGNSIDSLFPTSSNSQPESNSTE